jgi:hypothetical protein
VRPIRRFLEYVSLLEELKRFTSEGHPDYRMTQDANKIFKDALATIDRNKIEAIRKVRDIQCTLVFPPKHPVSGHIYTQTILYYNHTFAKFCFGKSL